MTNNTRICNEINMVLLRITESGHTGRHDAHLHLLIQVHVLLISNLEDVRFWNFDILLFTSCCLFTCISSGFIYIHVLHRVFYHPCLKLYYMNAWVSLSTFHALRLIICTLHPLIYSTRVTRFLISRIETSLVCLFRLSGIQFPIKPIYCMQ